MSKHMMFDVVPSHHAKEMADFVEAAKAQRPAPKTERDKNGMDVFLFPNSPPSRLLAKSQRRPKPKS